MTDDEADALLYPPRRWPPLSAAAAAGLLLLPVLAMAVLAVAHRRWTDLLVPVIGLLVIGRPALNLLCGERAGIGGGLGVLALVAVVCGLPAAVAMANGEAGLDLALAAVPVVSWIGIVGFLLWWPATRRWCGMLPPADPDDN